MKQFLAVSAWAGFTTLTLILSLGSYLNISRLPQVSFRPQANQLTTETLSGGAVNPQVLGTFAYAVKSEDAIPEIVKKYLAKYDSPLLPYADVLVETARHYRLDPRLLVAIAQQESNLCKKIPEGSYNCWGWGIHSRGTLGFASYPEAITAVTKGLAENYLGRGLTTPEEIMVIYTPLSEGSWAKGVQQFLNEMH